MDSNERQVVREVIGRLAEDAPTPPDFDAIVGLKGLASDVGWRPSPLLAAALGFAAAVVLGAGGLLVRQIVTADTDEPAEQPTESIVQASTTTSTSVDEAPVTIPAETMPPMQLPSFPGQWELAQAWALWESQGLDGYQFGIGGVASSSFGSYEVFVSGDDVSVVPVDPVPTEWPLEASFLLGPVERLFALIESIPSEYLSVEYDPTMGYPTSIAFDGPFIDDELSIWVTDLRPLTDDLPQQTVAAPASLLERGYQRVDLIVEATIGAPVRIDDAGFWSAWVVEIDDAVVHHIRKPRWIRSGLSEVRDRARSGPRTLRGYEGERLVLFLFRELDGSWGVYWAARRTGSGLEFLGPEAENSTLNEEIPQLCFPDSPRDADTELEILIRWAEGLGPFSSSEEREAALSDACLIHLTF